jgi:hypothetical protein
MREARNAGRYPASISDADTRAAPQLRQKRLRSGIYAEQHTIIEPCDTADETAIEQRWWRSCYRRRPPSPSMARLSLQLDSDLLDANIMLRLSVRRLQCTGPRRGGLEPCRAIRGVTFLAS